MRTIVLFALRDEAPTLCDRYANIHIIGVGKVQSAINAMRLIQHHLPDRVVSMGTAGGITLGHGIWRANRLVQHDVDHRPLGLPPGHTLGDPHPIIELGGQGYTCGSGDLFVTNPKGLRMLIDMVEMEAYSIARAAMLHGIDVEVWKYISDGANDSGAEEWTASVSAGEALYLQTLESIGVKLEARS